MMDNSRIHGGYRVTPFIIDQVRASRFTSVYTHGGVGNEGFVAVIVVRDGSTFRQHWTGEPKKDPADAIKEAKDIAFAAGIACHMPEIVPAIERAADAASTWVKTAFQGWLALSPTARWLAIARFVEVAVAEMTGDKEP